VDKLRIRGGERLIGEVRVGGAKNAALPLICAALLAPGVSRLSNVPKLRDIDTIKRLLESIGIGFDGEDVLQIDAEKISDHEAPYDLVRTMRASVLILGPLLARTGKARVSLPGGCAIGARPIDQHLKGLSALGAELQLVHGYIEASAGRLRGAEIYLDTPTVTGTENIMMAAATAQGVTVIENAAMEPEVQALADFLNAMGGRVSGAGTEIIRIEGVESLVPANFKIIPDRIQAATFMAAAAMTRGNVKVLGCEPSHMEAVLHKLKETGTEITVEEDGVRIIGPHEIKSVDIKTLPYPGFPTDMQAQFMAMMTLGNGISVISETVFENRFMHVNELLRMGAKIKIEGHSAIVSGVSALSGARVMATDLRASASLVLAGLAAEGKTEVLRIYHLDRGYEKLEESFAALGASIERVKA